MPTYYVEDYDGERSKDAAEPLSLNVPEDSVTAKVVVEDEKRPAAKKTSRAKTK